MEERIKFDSEKIRELFFKEILKNQSLKRWTTLASKYNLSRKLLAKYRFGELTLPKKLWKNMLSEINKEKLEFFAKRTLIIKDNWGQIKGGNRTYLKYRYFFDEGRKKGLKSIRQKQNISKFNSSMKLSKELSYFIGLFIGDGFSNKYGKSYQIQFVGHVDEQKFYQTTFVKLTKDLFNLYPKIYKSNKGNFIKVNIYSKDLLLFLSSRFKIPTGRKSSIVLIPEEIKSSPPEIILSFIAGLYDAEGCVFFDKRKEYKKPYPRFDIHMHNLPLINQISFVLNSEKIHHYLYTNKRRILIYGKESFEKFLVKIPIKNPKHIDKLKGEYGEEWANKFIQT